MCIDSRRRSWRSGGAHALWMSGVVLAVSSLWRGGLEILLDVGGNAAHDVLGGFLGRTGEWLILAAALAGYAVYLRGRHAPAVRSNATVHHARARLQRSAMIRHVRWPRRHGRLLPRRVRAL